MAKTRKMMFCETQLNDRMVFGARIGTPTLENELIYRRICQIGDNPHKILWLESKFGEKAGQLAECTPDSTITVHVIMED